MAAGGIMRRSGMPETPRRVSTDSKGWRQWFRFQVATRIRASLSWRLGTRVTGTARQQQPIHPRGRSIRKRGTRSPLGPA